ncbi:hypothetical protein L873DRAFT_1802184 [Choiromyces venosus 120613-1]|uniref:Secreted protein n=1 Tax=Choiromyces venosus 120613-1 TaxID=1336337 RepID=A0A3N4K8I9_9PEZI|nr:hypothetical protein L873DRAFT_1802184 [Choiromyces venosus 120613-1]
MRISTALRAWRLPCLTVSLGGCLQYRLFETTGIGTASTTGHCQNPIEWTAEKSLILANQTLSFTHLCCHFLLVLRSYAVVAKIPYLQGPKDGGGYR